MKEFEIFGITTKTDRLSNVEDNFREVRSVDCYEDESLFVSRNIYKHDDDNDIRFRYQYAIQSYTNTDDGKEKTWYYLFLVPTFNSLSKRKRESVMSCTSDNPDIIDVFDYGMYVLMASECQDGGFDKHMIEKIVNVVDFVDRMRGFYLDGFQNRIGSSGWDYLYDFIKDKDLLKAALKRSA